MARSPSTPEGERSPARVGSKDTAEQLRRAEDEATLLVRAQEDQQHRDEQDDAEALRQVADQQRRLRRQAEDESTQQRRRGEDDQLAHRRRVEDEDTQQLRRAEDDDTRALRAREDHQRHGRAAARLARRRAEDE